MAKAVKAATSTAKKATNTVRRCSKYNEFIKAELTKVKKENAGLPHKECFRVAAARWKNSPENPNYNAQVGSVPVAKQAVNDTTTV